MLWAGKPLLRRELPPARPAPSRHPEACLDNAAWKAAAWVFKGYALVEVVYSVGDECSSQGGRNEFIGPIRLP
ncbi:MAG TPA: hypothetical protein VGQ83_24470 [Polyangia bacterium]